MSKKRPTVQVVRPRKREGFVDHTVKTTVNVHPVAGEGTPSAHAQKCDVEHKSFDMVRTYPDDEIAVLVADFEKAWPDAAKQPDEPIPSFDSNSQPTLAEYAVQVGREFFDAGDDNGFGMVMGNRVSVERAYNGGIEAYGFAHLIMHR